MNFLGVPNGWKKHDFSFLGGKGEKEFGDEPMPSVMVFDLGLIR
jgi:hypothetical protein